MNKDALRSGTVTSEDLADWVITHDGILHELQDRVAVLETVLQRVHDELSVIDPME